MASVCPRQTKGITCRHLLSSQDHSISLLQHNKLVWTREEALASIVAVEIIELPMSDRDQAIETEFDQKESKSNYLYMLREIIREMNNINQHLKKLYFSVLY